ncbi:MAG: asparagine synthase (glutamine-hydrolyzing) [Vicinamibacterales bacterium]
MCGISGLVALDGPLAPAFPPVLRAMTTAIAHRGPDGDGFVDCGFASLGHRRLSIIDRAGGHQPMANEDDTCWIVFNGEIYNHKPLRRELEARGHRFRTVSDTEVILHAYEEFGERCLDRLNGMFAFAICDTRRREVFIARDRLGKKPVFYGVFDGVLHFASEIKALRVSPAWQGDLDLSALEGYLSLGYFIEPQTAYRHVRKLEAAHWMRISAGRIETRRYWDVTEFDTDTRPDAVILEDLEALLADAVACRLESEVPLGAFLSGGIDSGLVVSWMAEAQGKGVVTTSVGFEERAHNELEAAAVTARAFETRHFPTVLSPRLDEVFDPLIEAFDEPFADASAIPTYYVSKAARAHVTVALTGDGGDEAFGGYDFRYELHARESRVRPLVPGAPGRALARTLGRLWPRSASLPRSLRLGNVLENLGRPPEGAYYADLCFVKPWDARALLGQAPERDPAASPVYDAVTAPYRRCPSTQDLQRAQYADLMVYLPNDPLVKVDRASMAHSLEVRSPLLDYRVIEFAFRVPADRKSQPGQSKRLLRALGAKRLPARLATLPKKGFTAPVGEWIRGPYRAWFRDEVLSPSSAIASILDRRVLARWVEEDARGERDRSSGLWTAWCLERWARRFNGPATR